MTRETSSIDNSFLKNASNDDHICVLASLCKNGICFYATLHFIIKSLYSSFFVLKYILFFYPLLLDSKSHVFFSSSLLSTLNIPTPSLPLSSLVFQYFYLFSSIYSLLIFSLLISSLLIYSYQYQAIMPLDLAMQMRTCSCTESASTPLPPLLTPPPPILLLL